MPSNHPYGDHVERPNVYLPLTVAAFVFGTAMLVVDYRAGSSNHGLLLVVGLVALFASIGFGLAATLEHRRR